MKRHAVLLWVLCPLLLLLSATRPFVDSGGRVEQIPQRVASFELVERFEMTPDIQRLLGTDDAAQLRYESPELGSVFVVAVLHRENWKSVHPPHTCLVGSAMQLVSDTRVEIPERGGDTGAELASLGGPARVGRLQLTRVRDGQGYLSYYAYIAPPDLVTGDYWDFFFHHAPLALVRSGVGGCLLRVETWVPDGSAASLQVGDARCKAFVSAMLPEIRAILE